MTQLFGLLTRPDLCEAVCDCLCESKSGKSLNFRHLTISLVVQKGMPPKEKCLLVESLYKALTDANLISLDNEENLEGIAKLISAMGAELVHQNEKLCKIDGESEAAITAIKAAEVRTNY